MTILFNLLIITVSIFGLWGGAVWIVVSATRIAKRLGISELIIGLTIVAMGTSAPEFVVTVGAALSGHADIAVGNVVGSNIFNLGFILGGMAMVRALAIARPLVMRDGIVLIGTTLLLLLFVSDLTLTRLEGLILIALLVAYIALLLYWREAVEEEIPIGEFRWFEILRLLVGLGIVIVSGHYLVQAASDIARAVGISEWVIGVTIVAGGTSMPEFFTSLVAMIRGRHGISVGNLIGSDIFNLLGVLGLAALLQPMSVDPNALDSVLVLVGMVLLVVFLIRTRYTLSRAEGALLVAINVIRWFIDFSR